MCTPSGDRNWIPTDRVTSWEREDKEFSLLFTTNPYPCIERNLVREASHVKWFSTPHLTHTFHRYLVLFRCYLLDHNMHTKALLDISTSICRRIPYHMPHFYTIYVCTYVNTTCQILCAFVCRVNSLKSATALPAKTFFICHNLSLAIWCAVMNIQSIHQIL